MKYVLALDQGTTSSRAILYNRQGEIAAVAQREFQQLYPQPGWVEHDPLEIWESQIGVARDALNQVGAQAADVATIGITNQRETTIVWDRKTGVPVYNAIVWQDRRTAAICDAWRQAGLEPQIQAKTGLLIDAYFSASKIAWILEYVPGAREKAHAGALAFGTVDSWLIWKLTGGEQHVTDATNASRTMLFDIRNGAWDQDLLRATKIPRELIPAVCTSSGQVGQCAAAGLRGVPVAGIAGDQQAALFGQACFHPGMAKCTYGTGAFLLQNTGREPKQSQNRLLTTIAWQTGGTTEYALEGSVFTAGSVVQWLRDGLGLIRSSSEVEALAASCADSNDVFLIPAFTGLGAPHWDPHARGTIVGVTRGTTAAHIARAALESIAFQCADLMDAMGTDAGAPIHELRVDGGAAANNLLMQFQADLLQIPVVRPASVETTAKGAAYLAGIGTGFWSGREAIEAQWRAERVFQPQRPASEMNKQRDRWRDALERAKRWSQPA